MDKRYCTKLQANTCDCYVHYSAQVARQAADWPRAKYSLSVTQTFVSSLRQLPRQYIVCTLPQITILQNTRLSLHSEVHSISRLFSVLMVS